MVARVTGALCFKTNGPQSVTEITMTSMAAAASAPIAEKPMRSCIRRCYITIVISRDCT